MVALRKFSLAHVFTLLVLVLLVLYTFFPGLIHVDKYTAWFLALLFMMVILPSMRKGSIAYLFSFERDLKRARESVAKLNEKDGAKNGEVKKKVQKKMAQATDVTNTCLTTGKIRDQVKKRLYEIQKRWLAEKKRVKGLSDEELAEHLQKHGVLSQELHKAVQEILVICTPVDYLAQLKPEDVGKILETSLPVLERLHELAQS